MITFSPVRNTHIEVKTENQEVVIEAEQGPAMIEALRGQDTIKIILKANGWRIDSATEQAALDAAGLNGFAAAQQTAQGYIEIAA